MILKRVLPILLLLFAGLPLKAQTNVDGMTIPPRPAGSAMVYWTPTRLAQARLWFATHPFTVSPANNNLYLPWTDILFHHLLTGDPADCKAAYTLFSDPNLVPVTPATGYVGANQTRWYGEFQVLTYDWCYDALTPTQRSSLAATINTWMTLMSAPGVFPGNRGASYNNYFWGDVRNEMEWGLASYNDQPAQAKIFLDDVLAPGGRWDIFKLDALHNQSSGASIEGSQYGKYQLWYPLLPFASAKDYGRDLFSETSWFRDAVFYVLYTTTDALTSTRTGSSAQYQVTSFNDDQQWYSSVGGAATPVSNGVVGSYYGEFLLYAQNNFAPQVAGLAKQWRSSVKPQTENIWLATDASAAVQPTSSKSLALDFYAPGPAMAWARSAWGGTRFFTRFAGEIASGHWHRDAGQIELWGNGRYATRESVGYMETFAGWKGVGTVLSDDTLAHNSLIVNGRGQSPTPTYQATVRRLESAPAYFYVDADLTNLYRCTSPYCNTYSPPRDNPAVAHEEREFIFLRGLETLLVIDRTQTAVATDVATTSLECEVPWALSDATHEKCANGAETLSVTNLVPAAVTRNVDETQCSGCSLNGQNRLEMDSATNSTWKYSINILQAHATGTPDLVATIADSNPANPASGTFTLTVGNQIVVIQKGATSTAGSVNGAALRADVQPMAMTDAGPQWGANNPVTAPLPSSCSLSGISPDATVSATQSLLASGTVRGGQMTSMQLLLDGGNLGARFSGPGPYAFPWDTTTAANGQHTLSCACGDSNGNTGSCSGLPVNVNNAVSETAPDQHGILHPRVLLNAMLLVTLAKKATANDPAWTSLKSYCDLDLSAQVLLPDNAALNPPPSTISAGFGGGNYFPHLMAQGLCYQTMLQISPAGAGVYGSKLISILLAMSDPNHQTSPTGQPLYTENGGYDIRNYGVGMALGYDWAYNRMTAAQRQQVYTALNHWIDAWDSGALAQYNHPQSSYYAGYYNAKALTALSTSEDNPSAAAYWSAWLTIEHGKRVQPWYQVYLSGGGWPEGFLNYGAASINQAMPVIAAKDLQGIDLVGSSTAPYTFPKNMARYLMYFTWPNLTHMYDEDSGHAALKYVPGTPFAGTYQFFAYLSQYLRDPMAPQFHRFVGDAVAALNQKYPNVANVSAPAWSSFLFWDANAADSSYSQMPLSYWAQGIDQVAGRSDWTTSANWWSLRASKYVNSPVQAQQLFAAGEIGAVQGSTPLLVNPNAWLLRTAPGEANVATDAHGAPAKRSYVNTFQVMNTANPADLPNQTAGYPPAVGNITLGTGNARTTISAYEEESNYTLATASYLEDQYRSFAAPDCGPITTWTRQVIFVRPSKMVVYDRTGVCNAAYTQMMAWHTPSVPVQVAQNPAQPTVTRLDVSYNNNFAGSMIFVSPQAKRIATTDLDGEGLVYRTQVTPWLRSANNQWLTVFDMSADPSSVANVRAFNNTEHTMTGVMMRDSALTYVVLTNNGAAGTTVPGSVSCYMLAGASMHLLTELLPNAKYKVTVYPAGAYETVVAAPSLTGALTTTANGTLSFSVKADGTVGL